MTKKTNGRETNASSLPKCLVLSQESPCPSVLFLAKKKKAYVKSLCFHAGLCASHGFVTCCSAQNGPDKLSPQPRDMLLHYASLHMSTVQFISFFFFFFKKKVSMLQSHCVKWTKLNKKNKKIKNERGQSIVDSQ
jgi:hypothetical protein